MSTKKFEASDSYIEKFSECYILVLDSIHSGLLRNSKEAYELLEVIRDHTDGAISELLFSKLRNYFGCCFKDYVKMTFELKLEKSRLLISELVLFESCGGDLDYYYNVKQWLSELCEEGNCKLGKYCKKIDEEIDKLMVDCPGMDKK